MTNTRTAQAYLALEQIGARTTIASFAAGWLRVRMPAAPFGAGRGSSAPTRRRPRW